MALSADDLDYLNFALAALPKWMNDGDEFLHGAAKLFGTGVKGQIDYWLAQTLIGQATGATGTTPDWLRQHARDRGSDRQNAETDVALRIRLRNTPDAITRNSILDAANLILAAEGIVGVAAMVEMPRDAAHLGAFTADTGVGGAFAAHGASPGFQFTPTTPFAAPPYRDPAVIRLVQSYAITIAGAANGANNGTFVTTGLNGNAAVYNNGAGVAGADAGATWTIIKKDRRGNTLNGHGKAFCSRGFRCTHAGKPGSFFLMLPFGSTVGTLASIVEMLRQKKAAGFTAFVERRLHP